MKIIFAGLIIYVVAVFLLPLIVINKNIIAKQSRVVPIYIKTNGVHTDIVVPTKNDVIDWSTLFTNPTQIAQDTSYKYVAIGWGDKGFYLHTPTWADLKASTACNAAFGLSTTALHVTYYTQMPTNATCKQIMITTYQYQQLINFIKNSLHNQQFIAINTTSKYGTTDAFYEATGTYSLFHTCNTWANNCLKNCGQPCCFWTATDKGIFDVYQ